MFAKAELKWHQWGATAENSPPFIFLFLSLVVDSRVVRGWSLAETLMKLELLALHLPTPGSKWSHCISKAASCWRWCQSPLHFLIPFLSHVSNSASHTHIQKQLDLSLCETKSGRDRTSRGEQSSFLSSWRLKCPSMKHWNRTLFFIPLCYFTFFFYVNALNRCVWLLHLCLLQHLVHWQCSSKKTLLKTLCFFIHSTGCFTFSKPKCILCEWPLTVFINVLTTI